MSTTTERAQALRAWAEGSTTMTAAVELLSTTLDGRLLHGPWIGSSTAEHGLWFDADAAVYESSYLSSGERRVLMIAASLVSADHPVDLGDAIAGLDPASFTAVMQALGVAYGLSTD